MSERSTSNSASGKTGVVHEQDLRDEFQKVKEQVEKAIREAERDVPRSVEEEDETVFVVEPVYTYQVHASS